LETAKVGRVEQVWAKDARYYWQKQRAEARRRSTAARDDARPLEFAYHCYRYYPEYDSREYDVIDRHRIVKKTRRRIYVEVDRYEPDRPLSGEWRDYHRPTFVLDRRAFESDGKAERRPRGWWDHSTYYADPAVYHAEQRLTDRSACFEALGLPADASVDDVKAAYRRLSWETHPDAGGSDSDFVRLRSRYEEALRIVRLRQG
jgi:hypothetical protein